MRRISLFFLLLMLLSACEEHNRTAVKFLEELAEGVEHQPRAVLARLDSIKPHLPTSEAVMYKWNLLHIKATDKAEMPLDNDSLMQRVVDFFERNGSRNEILESYYYMGSTWRDLHNYPKAVEWYRKAVDYGMDNLVGIDTAVISCVNAQLAYIFTRRCDYTQSLECLRQNYELMLHRADHHVETHELAGAYANRYYYNPEDVCYRDSAFLCYTENLRGYQQERFPLEIGRIAESLGFYVRNSFPEEAEEAMRLIDRFNEDDFTPNVWVNKGYYYREKNMADSTEICWLKAYAVAPTTLFRNNAGFHLARLYREKGDKDRELFYANVYMETQDTLNRITMVEQTTNANNEYLYYKNEKEVSEAENTALHAWLTGFIAVSVLLALFSITIVYYRKRNMTEKKKYAETLRRRDEIRTQVADIVEFFRSTGNTGIEKPSEKEWEELYLTVDKGYPDFLLTLRNYITDAEGDTTKLVYMKKAGLTPSQMANIIGIKNTALSQRLKRLRERLGEDAWTQLF